MIKKSNLKPLKNQITNQRLIQYKLHLNEKEPWRKSLPRK